MAIDSLLRYGIYLPSRMKVRAAPATVNRAGDDDVTRIGFIGLGIMGGPMAAHLAGAGHQGTVYARNPAAARTLAAAGGTPVGSVAEAVADAEVVITMLPNHPEVEQVVLGEDGVLANAAEHL